MPASLFVSSPLLQGRLKAFLPQSQNGYNTFRQNPIDKGFSYTVGCRGGGPFFFLYTRFYTPKTRLCFLIYIHLLKSNTIF